MARGGVRTVIFLRRGLLHAAHACGRVDFGDKALQHLARAEFYELCGAVGNHVADALCPAYRGGELSHEVGFDFGGVGVGQRVHVLEHGAYRGVELGSFDSCSEFCAGGLHAWRVEGPAYFELEGAFGSCGLEGLAGCVDSRYLAGDNELSGAVVVSADHGAFDAGADFLYLFVGEGEDCRHGRFGELAGFLHCAGAGSHEAEAVFKAECSGSHER